MGKFNEPVEGNPDHGRMFLWVERIRNPNDEQIFDVSASTGMWFFEDIRPMTAEELQKYPL